LGSRVEVLPDKAQFIARHIVTRALDDEIAYRGAAGITETLVEFLEHRFAAALRPVFEENKRARFDA
jgi:hypothetical protein